MKFKFYLSSLTFVLATFFMVNAQTNTGTGKVSDGASSLFGINVKIQGASDGVVTDENGIFTLSSEQALPWNLEFSSLGYATQSLSVVSTSQLISITLQAGEELDEVTITGLRKPEKVSETITSISTVLLSEIENRPTFNAATLLDNIVGVQVDNQGPNRTNVTLRDNVDVFSTSTLVMLDYRDISQVGLSFFDPGNSNLSMIDLERVEIIRGPQAALYGPGVDAGVVHYLSKDPFKYPGTTVQLQTGGISNGGRSKMAEGNNLMKSVYFRHAVSNADQTLGYKFNLRHSETPEWDLNSSQSTSIFGATGTRNIVDPLDGAQVGTVSDMRDGSVTGADATLYYRPSNNFSLTTVAGIGNTVGNAWASGTGEVFANITQGFLQFRMNTKNLFVQYNYTANVNGTTGDKIGFNYRTGGVSYIDSKQSQLQVQYEIPFEKLNTDVSIGFEHKLARFQSYKRTFGRNEGFTDYRLYGAYASSKTKLGDKFILSLAGRYDSYAFLGGAKSISPRAGLVFKPTPRHSFRLSYNKAHTPNDAMTLFLDLPVQPLMFGGNKVANAWLMGNMSGQTFNNVKTRFLGALSAAGINNGQGMDHSRAFGAISAGLLPGLGAGAFDARLGALASTIKSFIPWLSSSTTLATINGTGAITRGKLVDGAGNVIGLEEGDASKLQINTTYEFGFKGMMSDNLTWSVDIYNTKKENFIAQTTLSPFVDLTGLGTDLAGTIYPLAFAEAGNRGFTGALQVGIAQTIAGLYQGGAAQMEGPVGIIETDQAPNGTSVPSLMMGYKNFGQISYWGFDTALKYRPSDNLTLFANYSVISQTEFEDDDFGDIRETGTYSMNHSKHRVKTGLNYNRGKWVFGASHKYDDGFNANMGVYSGIVPQKNIYDTNIGYKINAKTQIDIALYNVTNQRYSLFPGMPEMGTMGMATVKLDL